MHKPHPLLAVAVLALSFLGLLAAPAFAAPVAKWSSIEVRWIVGSNGTPAVLVSGELPASAKLPAAVRLGVPKGTQVSWAGEIVGTDPSKDPTVQYATRSAKDHDAIDFTLSRARRGQIEYDAASSLVTSGDRKTVSMSWTSPVDVPAVDLTIQPPSGATVADAGGASADQGGTYTKTFKKVKAGQNLKLDFSYTGGTLAAAGQPQAQTGPAASTSSSDLPIVPFVVLAGLIAGTVLILKALGARKEATDDDEKTPVAAPRHRSRPSPSPEDDTAFDFSDDEPSTSPSARKPRPAAPKASPKPKKPTPAKRGAATAKASGAKTGAGAPPKTASPSQRTTTPRSDNGRKKSGEANPAA